MNETKITATLPRVDIEIVRRDDPERHAEVMTIEMRATPSFRAMGDYLSANPATAMALMWAAPMALWSGAMAAFWRPWLALAAPQGTPTKQR